MASRVVADPELILEVLNLDLSSINKPVSIGFGDITVEIYPSNEFIYVVAHDGDKRVNELIEELRFSRPTTYNQLVRILRAYIAPRRQDIEKLIAKVFNLIEPLEVDREIPEEVEVDVTGGNFYDMYSRGDYLDAWRVLPREKEMGLDIGKALRTFAARLTRLSPPIQQVPSKRLIYEIAAKIPEDIRRYYRGLIDEYPNISTFAEFVQKFYAHGRDLLGLFRHYKMLFTTLAVPLPGNTPYLIEAAKNVPENRKDVFISWGFSALLSEGRINDYVLTKSLEGLRKNSPFYYAYYLPISIYDSVSLRLGGSEIHEDILLEFLHNYEKPWYIFLKNSTLTRALPVLLDRAPHQVEKVYHDIGIMNLKRYLSERNPHIVYGISASVLSLAGLAFSDDSLLGLITQPEILRSLRLLYRLSAKGSRSAAASAYRLIPALALAILSKDKDDKHAREMLIKSFLMVNRYDYVADLIIKATEGIGLDDVAEVLKKTYVLS